MKMCITNVKFLKKCKDSTSKNPKCQKQKECPWQRTCWVHFDPDIAALVYFTGFLFNLALKASLEAV